MFKKILIIFFLCTLVNVVSAQFYDGHNMTFGKNRVQYRNFYWNYYRFDKYDIYFYDKGDKLAKYTNKIADKKLKEIEILFGHALQKRIIFLVYNRLSEFKQSNIGLVTGNEDDTGGTMRIIENKVFLYFDGDHKKFQEQITAAISEVILNETIYGGNLREKLSSSTLLTIPDWFSKGLISYLSCDWNFEIEDKVKDGILNNRYGQFNKLKEQDLVYAGHSLWRYIADVYGKNVIPNIIYMTKVNKNPENGFLFVLGVTLNEITPDWIDYYKARFETDTLQQGTDSLRKKIVKRPKKQKHYQNVKNSPNGKYVAYTSNQLGKYKIYLYNTEKERRKKIYKRGYKLNLEVDYSFPVLAWHPKSDILSFITEEKGHLYLNNYSLSSRRKKRRILPFQKVLSMDYSDDGYELVLSAVQKGISDIYVFSVTAGTTVQVTGDLADDFNPKFADRSSKIIFSSNRLSDTIHFEEYINRPVGRTFDLFVYDYKHKSRKLSRVTKTPYFDETQPVVLSRNIYSYLSDENGIINRYIAKYDSTVNFVDTTVHYRYYTSAYPLSNNKNNIYEHDITKKQFSEITYSDSRNHLYYDTLKTKRNSFFGEIKNTQFRNILTQQYIRTDSLEKIAAIKEKERKEKERLEKQAIKIEAPPETNSDSMFININNYIFEREKYSDYYNKKALLKLNEKNKKQKPSFPKKQSYLTNFYVNHAATKVDFGFSNTSYQVYTGQAIYFTPGLNVLTKIGTNDLFEDYKIIAGFRFAGNFDSNEYLLSFENLKNRWDKQAIYHRQTYKRLVGPYSSKTITQKFMYLLKYPFSQVSAIQFTGSFRNDQVTLLPDDYFSLLIKDKYQNWVGMKLEYIFDNTRNMGLNLYEGARAKIWSEFYKEIGQEESDMIVLGADYRYYLRLHRCMIYAGRIAGGTSLGNSRLLYYLGGVDNWMSSPTSSKTFDSTTDRNENVNWKFQTIGTNMRGFRRNVRNGSSFIVINNEVRLPVFRYFINRPINSDFFNNFQAVGFADLGTAFCGWSPLSDENDYNTTTYTNEAVSVTIDLQKSPFVGGVGFGFRSRILGYFLRTDWAWGIENGVVLDRMFYLSLGLDF